MSRALMKRAASLIEWAPSRGWVSRAMDHDGAGQQMVREGTRNWEDAFRNDAPAIRHRWHGLTGSGR
jgi:hypothetical protein